ncbi:TetR/AcrR family transcriptional regulator [Thiovibrio sp. JS02]
MASHPKHLPAEERRAVTVKAVVELAAERDPGEITTAAIAKHMNLTQGALFRHFQSKDSLLQAVMEWVAEQLLFRVDKAAAAALSPLAGLEAVFMAHIDFVAQHPGVPRILFGQLPLQRSEETISKRMVATLIRRYGERLKDLIRQGKECGELDPLLDADAAVIMFIGTVQGLVLQSLLAGDVGQIRRNAPRIFAIYRRGIRRTP